MARAQNVSDIVNNPTYCMYVNPFDALFFAMNQRLVDSLYQAVVSTNFDDIGKFLAVVLLVIQLAACAGTFPLETEPSFFSAISPFMPMTYSVELLRESFVSIDHNLLIKNIVILGSIFIAFTTLTIITEYIKTKTEKVEVK